MPRPSKPASGERAGPRGPVLHLVACEGRPAAVLRGRPGHCQAGQRRGGHRRRIQSEGRLGHIGDDDGHLLTGAAPETVADLDAHRVPRPGLVIERRPGPHLAAAGVHGKGGRVGTRQRIGQHVAVGVGRPHRRPHRLAGGRVLRHPTLDLVGTGGTAQVARRVRAVRRVRGEERSVVDPGAPRAGRRPGPGAFVVEAPHLHLVGGVRIQAAQLGRRAGDAEAGLGERDLPLDPVLHLVGGQGRTARVLRGRPGRRQARRRSGRQHRRLRGQGRLRHVGDDDGHRLTRAASAAIADLDPDRVPRPGLVIEGLPGPHLAAARVHGKGTRVRARQRVGQGVAVGVGRRHRRPHRLAGGRVLRHPPLELGG